MSASQEVDKRSQALAPSAGNRGSDPMPFLEWKHEFNEKTGKYEHKSMELSDGSKIDQENLKKALKRATGTSDVSIAERILNDAAYGMTSDRRDVRMNRTSALLSALGPKDETEAMLLGQFLALQDSGMKCLRLANLPEQGFYHEEKLFHLANKLLNTANQTMQTVMKYRSGGQQTVQVIHVHNEGQAIVAQNLSHSTPGERIRKKFEN